MLTKQNVLERVRAIIVEQLGVELDEVTENASVVDDLGADSLDLVELVMAAEEEFEITVDADEEARLYGKVNTVAHAATYICERLGISQ